MVVKLIRVEVVVNSFTSVVLNNLFLSVSHNSYHDLVTSTFCTQRRNGTRPTTVGMYPSLLSNISSSAEYTMSTRCSSPFLSLYGNKPLKSVMHDASVMPGLRLPSQLNGIITFWPVPNCTARWMRHVCKPLDQGCCLKAEWPEIEPATVKSQV